MDEEDIRRAEIKGAEEQAERARALKDRVNKLWTESTDTQDEPVTLELSDEEAENLIVQLMAAANHWKESADESREKLKEEEFLDGSGAKGDKE